MAPEFMTKANANQMCGFLDWNVEINSVKCKIQSWWDRSAEPNPLKVFSWSAEN